MSFSSDARLEASRLLPTKRCCTLAELAGIFRVERLVSAGDGDQGAGVPAADVEVVAAHPAIARKVYLLLKGAGVDTRVRVDGGKGAAKRRGRRSYRVAVPSGARAVMDEIAQAVGGDLAGAKPPLPRCCRRAYLRGAFLCRGSLTAPEKTYHLEIAVDRRETARSIAACLDAFGIRGRVSRRKGIHIVYLKESEEIAAFLNLIGAHQALLELENVRIVKGMRNRVNRLVNCETANVGKTVNAAVAQLDAIRLIQERAGLKTLPAPLRALAEKRLENPYASLRELGELLSPRVSKSGASYRMRTILAIAAELEEDRAASGKKETCDEG